MESEILTSILSGSGPWILAGIIGIVVWLVKDHFAIKDLKQWREKHEKESRSIHDDIESLKETINKFNNDLGQRMSRIEGLLEGRKD